MKAEVRVKVSEPRTLMVTGERSGTQPCLDFWPPAGKSAWERNAGARVVGAQGPERPREATASTGEGGADKTASPWLGSGLRSQVDGSRAVAGPSTAVLRSP